MPVFEGSESALFAKTEGQATRWLSFALPLLLAFACLDAQPTTRASGATARRKYCCFNIRTPVFCPDSGNAEGMDVPDTSGSARWPAAVGLSQHRGACTGVPDRGGTRGVGVVRSGKPSAARSAGRGDGVLRGRVGAVPVRVSAGGAALPDGGAAVGVVGRDATRVGKVVDFARADALGVCAVRGVACGPGGAGGGPGDARVVVSRPAPGGVRRVHAERAGRSDEPGRRSERPARHVAELLSPRFA